MSTWTERYESLLYTAAALGTQSDDTALVKSSKRVHAVLQDWREIEADGVRLKTLAIAARARVQVADAALDHRLAVFARAILQDVSEDSELYRRFFPEPHEEVIALGLDAELPTAMLVAGLLADEQQLIPEGWREHREPVQRAVQLGNVALGDRAEAYAALGRHRAREEAWLETASAVDESVRERIRRIAESRGLSPRWAASFFPR